jgi:ubiquinone/menaquinone biosynthesis C-methylase UbiE
LHLELRRRFPAALVAGVDLSPAMLAATARLLRRSSRAGVGRGQLIRADALHLPVRDAVFELVICTYMLDLLPDARIAAAIREFARVLRAGGLLIVAAMDGRQPPGVAAVFRWSASHWPWISGGCRPIDLGSRFDYAQWELCTHERVGQSGFGSELLIVRLKARSIPPGSQYEARELRHSEHPDAPI